LQTPALLSNSSLASTAPHHFDASQLPSNLPPLPMSMSSHAYTSSSNVNTPPATVNPSAVSPKKQMLSRTSSGNSHNQDPTRSLTPIDETEASQYRFTDKKPPYSYASLIAQAIQSVEGGKMTLSTIYQFVNKNYPYYKLSATGWQVKKFTLLFFYSLFLMS